VGVGKIKNLLKEKKCSRDKINKEQKKMSMPLLSHRIAHALSKIGQKQTVVYKNWRGETATRTIVPLRLHYGSSIYHPEPQFLLKVVDLEKNAERDFALCDIQHWSDSTQSHALLPNIKSEPNKL
jgi:hypothetical protein